MGTKAVAVVLVVAATVGWGCLDVVHWSEDRFLDAGSYFGSTRAIERADAAIARAEQAGVDRTYPYMLDKARAYVAQARLRHERRDYPGASTLADEAERTCDEAVRFVEERAERTGRRTGNISPPGPTVP